MLGYGRWWGGGALAGVRGEGERHGVVHEELLRSHTSSRRRSSDGSGPPLMPKPVIGHWDYIYF